MPRRYSEQQLAYVLRDANAKDWSDVMDYLEARPDRTGLDHDRLCEMEDDLADVKANGEPFSLDAARVYRAIESRRPTASFPASK